MADFRSRAQLPSAEAYLQAYGYKGPNKYEGLNQAIKGLESGVLAGLNLGQKIGEAKDMKARRAALAELVAPIEGTQVDGQQGPGRPTTKAQMYDQSLGLEKGMSENIVREQGFSGLADLQMKQKELASKESRQLRDLKTEALQRERKGLVETGKLEVEQLGSISANTAQRMSQIDEVLNERLNLPAPERGLPALTAGQLVKMRKMMQLLQPGQRLVRSKKSGRVGIITDESYKKNKNFIDMLGTE